MIDPNSETLISLADAAKTLPARREGKKPHLSCLYRWTTHGCKGVVLKSLQCGGTRVTSKEALARFFERLGGEGRDTLEGGDGSDGLFGGVDEVRDSLWGDEGTGTWDDDRFLTRTWDVKYDLCPRDAEICISDGSTPWTEMDVYYLDRQLATLQQFAETTLVLKDTVGSLRNPGGSLPIEFEKETASFFDTHVWGQNDRPWQDDDGTEIDASRLHWTAPPSRGAAWPRTERHGRLDVDSTGVSARRPQQRCPPSRPTGRFTRAAGAQRRQLRVKAQVRRQQ